MNNIYLQERLVELKGRELEWELAQNRLLREAGLSGASLLARAADALHKLLKARNDRLQGHRSAQHQAYSS